MSCLRTGSLGLAMVIYCLVGCGSDGSGTGTRTRGLTPGATPGVTPNGQAGAGATPGSPAVIGADNPRGPAGSSVPTPPMNDGSCGRTDITASRVLPSVMLLVDGSMSMEGPYGTPDEAADATNPMMTGAAAPAAISRWQAVRSALVDADGVVPKLEGLVRFGLAVYGTMPTCPLPLGTIDPALNNYQAINASLPAMPPGFTTPTGAALDQIVDLLPDPKNNLDETIGPQIIILATDGDPNSCNTDIFTGIMTDYAPSIAAAMKAQQKNLRMYVISVGQDAAAQHLQEMANLGAGLTQMESPGAEVYYPADPAALATTLETLIGDELSCELSLEGKGVKLGSECLGTVTLNGVELECNGADGWALLDSRTVALQGASCETFKNASDAQLNANFPCELLLE